MFIITYQLYYFLRPWGEAPMSFLRLNSALAIYIYIYMYMYVYVYFVGITIDNEYYVTGIGRLYTVLYKYQ